MYILTKIALPILQFIQSYREQTHLSDILSYLENRHIYLQIYYPIWRTNTSTRHIILPGEQTHLPDILSYLENRHIYQIYYLTWRTDTSTGYIILPGEQTHLPDILSYLENRHIYQIYYPTWRTDTSTRYIITHCSTPTHHILTHST